MKLEEIKSVGQLIDFIKRSHLLCNLHRDFTRKQLAFMLNILYPHYKKQGTPFGNNMAKRRQAMHIAHYFHLHNIY